jgi:glyoxylase-like metal-dependent hydrolase (beta-lactamase superfamily II)
VSTPEPAGGKTVDLGEGVFEIFLPLPAKPTIINVYLIDLGDGEWALVDTGTARPPSREAFRLALAEIGVPKQGLTTLLATHHHPDHFGASAALVEDYGTKVYLHPKERETIAWMNEVSGAAMVDHVRRHGIPIPPEVKDAPKPTNVWAEGFRPAPHTDHELADGERLRLGKREFEVIHVAFWSTPPEPCSWEIICCRRSPRISAFLPGAPRILSATLSPRRRRSPRGRGSVLWHPHMEEFTATTATGPNN